MQKNMIAIFAERAEGTPVCQTCGPIRRPVGTGDDARQVRYLCPHQEEAEQEEQRARVREGLQSQNLAAARAFYDRSHPPEEYRAITLAGLDERACSKAGRLAAIRFVETWNDRLAQGQGMILSGDIGTGKTLVAAALANGVVEKSGRVAFLTVTELQRRMKHWDTADAFLVECKDCHLLVLDDFGAERVTEWAASGLFDLIDARYQSRRPTVFTTNLGGKALTDHYIRSLTNGRDQMPEAQARLTVERVLSRIRQRCAPVLFTGPDQREKAADHSWLTQDGAA